MRFVISNDTTSSSDVQLSCCRSSLAWLLSCMLVVEKLTMVARNASTLLLFFYLVLFSSNGCPKAVPVNTVQMVQCWTKPALQYWLSTCFPSFSLPCVYERVCTRPKCLLHPLHCLVVFEVREKRALVVLDWPSVQRRPSMHEGPRAARNLS